MFKVEDVERETGVQKEAIKYVSSVVMKSPIVGGVIGPGTLLACCIYGMLKSLGFKEQDITSILCYFNLDLNNLAHSYEVAKEGTEVESISLQIWDGHIAVIRENAYDFKEMEPLGQVRTPVWFVGFVLPVLYSHAAGTVRPPEHPHSSGEG